MIFCLSPASHFKLVSHHFIAGAFGCLRHSVKLKIYLQFCLMSALKFTHFPTVSSFPSRSQWLRFYFHADDRCAHLLLQCSCLINSAWVLPRFYYFVHDPPKCQDTVNKMTTTTSCLFFTLPIIHFLSSNKQGKMYLLLTLWDQRSGICQKTAL